MTKNYLSEECAINLQGESEARDNRVAVALFGLCESRSNISKSETFVLSSDPNSISFRRKLVLANYEL